MRRGAYPRLLDDKVCYRLAKILRGPQSEEGDGGDWHCILLMKRGNLVGRFLTLLMHYSLSLRIAAITHVLRGPWMIATTYSGA